MIKGRKKKQCPRCQAPLNPIYERVNFINWKGLWRNKMIRILHYYWCREHGLQVLQVK